MVNSQCHISRYVRAARPRLVSATSPVWAQLPQPSPRPLNVPPWPDRVGRQGHRGADNRRRPRRRHVAGRRAARRLRPGRAARRDARFREHRCPPALRRRGYLCRRDLARPRPVAHRDDRDATRCRPRGHGFVSDDLRHLPRPAERVRVRHERGGRAYDAQVATRESRSELGWQLGSEDQPVTDRLDGRVPDSVAHAPYGPAPQTWGVNFHRNIQRTRERTYWAPLERVYELGRLSSAGELRGMELESPRNFKILPYVVGSADRNFFPDRRPDSTAISAAMPSSG